MGKKINKIGICDDDIRMCSDLESYILDYRKLKQEYIEVEIYYTGKKLRADLENGVIYDILFLDIELEKESGVEIGMYIRNELKNEVMQIIYISAYEKYALNLFKIRPMDFLIKPISYQAVSDALDTGIYLTQKNGAVFQYKQGRNYNKAYIKDILYFKSNDREVEMNTVKGKITFYSSLQEISEQLNEFEFFYAHKSYLVNYLHIRDLCYDKLLLSNGKIIQIAQNRRKAVREIHKKYLMKENGIEDV